MGYKVHNTYNHGHKGDSNFIVFVMKILGAHYFQNWLGNSEVVNRETLKMGLQV